MKKIIITGGAGFIGSHLSKTLLEQGNQIICIDNLSTGAERNIKELERNSNFKFIKHDIIDPIYFDYVDQIYNLACPASPVHYQKNAVRTIKINTIGMINMLGLARKHNARLLQASTSEVYGDPEEHPQKETYRGSVSTTGPRACYDEGKRVAEALCFDYRRMHLQMDIRVARIFNTYGPNMSPEDGRVVSNFIMQALKNETITMYGDGSQTRSFCFVTDLVDGLIKLMNTDKENATGPINLGNPDERTIKQVAEIIIEKTKSTSKIAYQKLPQDDPKKRCPDITLAKQKLNWQPQIMFEDGVDKAIEYFKKSKTSK